MILRSRQRGLGWYYLQFHWWHTMWHYEVCFTSLNGEYSYPNICSGSIMIRILIKICTELHNNNYYWVILTEQGNQVLRACNNKHRYTNTFFCWWVTLSPFFLNHYLAVIMDAIGWTIIILLSVGIAFFNNIKLNSLDQACT